MARMGIEDLVHAILTILSIVAVASAFHMIIEEGAINGGQIAGMGLSTLYLIVRYTEISKL